MPRVELEEIRAAVTGDTEKAVSNIAIVRISQQQDIKTNQLGPLSSVLRFSVTDLWHRMPGNVPSSPPTSPDKKPGGSVDYSAHQQHDENGKYKKAQRIHVVPPSALGMDCRLSMLPSCIIAPKSHSLLTSHL